MNKIWNLFTKREENNRKRDVSYRKSDKVLLSERLFEEYKSAREIWVRQAKEDDEFRRGAQWTKEQAEILKEANQAPIVVNIIEPAVDQAKAMLTANNPRFTSTAREDSDVKTGKVFSDLMSYVWDKSNGNMRLKKAIDDYYVKGMGVLMTYVDPYADYGKGEIKIVDVDPFDLYVDPNAKDPYLRDAAHIIISKTMTGEQLQDLYPDIDLSNAMEMVGDDHPGNIRHGEEDQIRDINNLSHAKFRVIDRYSKIKEIDFNVFNPENGRERILDEKEFQEFAQEPAVIVRTQDKEKILTEEEEVAEFIAIAEAGNGYFHFMMNPETGQPQLMPGQIHEEAIPDSEGTIEIITMADAIELEALIVTEIIENKINRLLSVGGVEYSNTVIPIENYPIVTFMNHHDRSPYPVSDVRFVKGLQEQINKIESLLIAHASNSTNVKWWVPRGGVDIDELEEKLNKAGTAVMEYNPEIGHPIQASPIPLPTELYKNKADKIGEVERILGIYALMQGDAQDAPNTYKGTVALDEYSQRRIRSKRTDIEEGINILANVVVRLMQETYQEHKVFRIINPSNLPVKEVAINQPIYDDYGKIIKKLNDITVGRYDIILLSGSMLPSNRYALAEYYKELLQIGAIDQQEFLMKTEVADVEGVLERAGVMSQMQNMVNQLQEEVKRLSGDMQTKDREISHLQKRVELEQFKSSLVEPKEKAKKASQLYEQLLNSEVKMEKEKARMSVKEKGNG